MTSVGWLQPPPALPSFASPRLQDTRLQEPVAAVFQPDYQQQWAYSPPSRPFSFSPQATISDRPSNAAAPPTAGPLVRDPPSEMHHHHPARPRRPRQQLTHRMRTERQWEVSAAFETFDDGSGEVGYHELKAAHRALGLPVKKAPLLQALRACGVAVGGDAGARGGLFGRAVFEEVLLKAFAERSASEDLLAAFQLFDREGRGRITLRDLRVVAREVAEAAARGDTVTDSPVLRDGDLRAMIECFDANRDGEIDEEEFVHIMQQSSLH